MALSLQKHNNAPKTTALCNSCLKSVINQTFVFRNTSWTWYLIQILLVESGGRLADGSFTIAWLPWDLNTKKNYISDDCMIILEYWFGNKTYWLGTEFFLYFLTEFSRLQSGLKLQEGFIFEDFYFEYQMPLLTWKSI